MLEFELYINNLLKKTKLTTVEKDDLKKELVEHLNNLKFDYLKNGLSEEDAINSVIKNFNSTEFIKEMNNFSNKQKLSSLNLKFLFKTNLILIFIYCILTASIFTVCKTNSNSNILYLITICLTLASNYYLSASNFIFKKHITSNILLTCSSFFFLEKIGLIIISKLYSLLSNNMKFNMFDLYSFDSSKIFIYIIVSITIILISLFNKISIPKTNLHFTNIDICILLSSILLNLVFYIYPNRFYLLNLIISKTFNITINTFDKNLLYMNINNNILIINIGIVILIIFILYKLIHFFTKNYFNGGK